jgi:hypothetical protein
MSQPPQQPPGPPGYGPPPNVTIINKRSGCGTVAIVLIILAVLGVIGFVIAILVGIQLS